MRIVQLQNSLEVLDSIFDKLSEVLLQLYRSQESLHFRVTLRLLEACLFRRLLLKWLLFLGHLFDAGQNRLVASSLAGSFRPFLLFCVHQRLHLLELVFHFFIFQLQHLTRGQPKH